MRRLLVLPLLLVLAACDGGADADSLDGDYDVTLFGDGRAVEGTGTLSLRVEPVDIDPASVSGTWQITRGLPNGTEYAASGVVRGSLAGRAVSLALERPEIADAGYVLTGTVEGGVIRGDWNVEYGVEGAGAPFEARR